MKLLIFVLLFLLVLVFDHLWNVHIAAAAVAPLIDLVISPFCSLASRTPAAPQQLQAILRSQCKLNVALVGVLQCELQLTAVDSPHDLHLVIMAKAKAKEVSTGQL